MVEFSVSLCLVLATFVTVNCAAWKEPCESSCVKAENCQFFGNLNKDEQTSWLNRFICDEPSAHTRKVCCPENVWQIEDPTQSQPQPNVQFESGSDAGVDLEKNSYQYRPNYNNYNYPNNNNYPSGNRRNQYDDQYGNQGWNNGGGAVDDEITAYENTRIWQNRHRQRPVNNGENPYFIPANRNTGSSFNGANSGGQTGQCPVTSFPPDHNSGCCGREATEDDRIAASNNQNSWMPQQQRPWRPYSDRKKRDTSDVEVTLDNRIAGGRETDLEQFPWTVLLKTTFIYPDKESAFSCGGSLISSRYVLTAGHCVYDQKGSVKGVEVFLAEYDKRTFPQDCKNVLGRGQQCVENIIIHAERVHIHPEYDDNRLRNDIAMLRLRENAPYTDYIRPICLPPINVDSPELSHLRLAVAGWGRNGQYKSNIKQSTVVNLVPNRECAESYPGLTKNQLCAAGYTGEDTCKGDSGGPLMMVYGGKYYVSGVVSGKRADAPCGTSVPSLYTNVYQYLQWIRSVITN